MAAPPPAPRLLRSFDVFATLITAACGGRRICFSSSGIRAELSATTASTRHESTLHAATAAHPPLLRSPLAGSARAARLSADPTDGHRRALWEIGTSVAGPLLIRRARRPGVPQAMRQLNPALPELFCAADHGTVRRYREAPGGGYEAELSTARDRAVLDWGLDALRGRILAFARECAAATELGAAAGGWGARCSR